MRTSSRPLPIVAAVLAVVFLFVASGLAQTTSAVITGTVADPTGAPIAGATVSLSNDSTGEQRTVQTFESGNFVFSAVLPGRYTLSVEHQGFKKIQKKELNITATERLSAGTIMLQVGSVTESIEVTAQATPVQTTSQERSAVLTTDQMDKLMSRGRDFLTLLRVLPGVIQTSDPQTVGRTGIPIMQGLRQSYSNITIDGASTNDLGSMQALGTPVNMDAISEVKVLMNNFQAEYGRTGGTVVNAVTKSGTRDFHGGGYYYKRHEQFNANNFFNNLNRQSKPRYRYNTWGWNVGGPVFVPGKLNTDKDKLFFFYSGEYLPTSSPGGIQRLTMPTELERQGNFSQSFNTNGTLFTIRDPLTGQPFAGNRIPSDRINPDTQRLVNALPKPNFFDTAVSNRNYNYVFQEVRPATRWNHVFRTDYNATNNLRAYVRGVFYRETEDGYQVPGGAAAWDFIKSRRTYNVNSGLVNLAWTASPTLINEFQAGAYNNRQGAVPASDAEVNKWTRKTLGINLPVLYPGINPIDLIPMASFGGIPNSPSFSADNRYPTRSSDLILSLTNNVTKIWNAHTFKAGVFLERVRYLGGAQGAVTSFGSYDFSVNNNNPLNTGHSYANALLGNFASYRESSSRIAPLGRAYTFDWFVQDNWRATRRLTLDFGVRFSKYTPYAQENKVAAGFMLDQFDPSRAPVLFRPVRNAANQRVAQNPLTGELFPAVYIGAFVPNSGNTANGMVLDDGSIVDRGLMNHQGLLAAPRIGFAYDVFGDGKMAIRGGAGIMYNTRERVLLLDVIANPPVQYTPTIYYSNIASLAQSTGILFPSNSGGISRNGDTPRVYSLSLGVQRELGWNTVLDVAYAGTLGRNLLQLRDINRLPYGARFRPENQDPSNPGSPLPDNYFRPISGYGSITIDEYASSSNYNSLQMQVNRRFSRGLLFGAAWTWSKALDYASNDWGGVATYLPLRTWNYGPSDFDRPHTLAINWTYDVPKLTSVIRSRPLGWVFDNWQFAGVAMFQTGQPRGVGIDLQGRDTTGGGDGVRVDLVGPIALGKSEKTFNRWVNTDNVRMPAFGSPGNASRVQFYGPGVNNFDLTFFKNFPIKERAFMQFRWEMYNAFNHTQFSNLNSTARFNAQGQQINTQFGQLTSARDARLMQGSLRFRF